ncbi:MAG TPA: cupin domain-containing protein, partial [Novosphingobium sp.]
LAGEEPQVLIPPGHWQAAEPRGGWTLVSCIVSPGFDFAGFELAPEGWAPRGLSASLASSLSTAAPKSCRSQNFRNTV